MRGVTLLAFASLVAVGCSYHEHHRHYPEPETKEVPKEAPKVDTAPRAQAAPPVVQERMVYVTRTGKKYHRSGCQYLRQSMIPMKLSGARAQGYGACSRCW